jgi:tRNA dimethylallyltransferase
MKKKMITVIGPTGSGKSRCAIDLAKKYDGEIISADSRQIYKHLDIGTGKESGKISTSTSRGTYTKKAYVCDGIPHYMIDIIQPTTEYNVAKFTKKAKNIASDIISRGKLPIVCGGTMFWAQALIEKNTFPAVYPNKDLRKKLSQLSKTQLLAQLKAIDPIYAKKVDTHNPVRMIRAIEIATKIGHVPEIKRESINPHEHLILAMSHPKAILHKRIEKRMDTWFKSGIFDEIHRAHFTYKMPWTKLESFGLEYKWCTRYVRGQVSYDEMRENTIRDLKKYAKRQMTWIRRWQRSGAKIHNTTSSHGIKLVKEFLKNK